THVERTRRRAAGEALSAITADFCRRLGVAARLVPMTDDKVRTRLRTEEGWLDFQDYFVRRRCAPPIQEIAYDGAASARAHPDLLDGYVLDRVDASEAEKLGIPVTPAHTLMTTLADRETLARCVLASADALAKVSA